MSPSGDKAIKKFDDNQIFTILGSDLICGKCIEVGVWQLVFNKLFWRQAAELTELADKMRLVGVATGICDVGILMFAAL